MSLHWYLRLAFLLLPALVGGCSHRLAHDTPSGGKVELTPTDWLGKRLSVLQEIDIGDRLASGRWRVLFCEDTSECASWHDRHYKDAEGEQVSLALVAMQRATDSLDAGDSVLGSMTAANKWTVPNAFEVLLEDGVVTSIIPRTALFPDYREAYREFYLDHVACGPRALIAVFDRLGTPLSDSERAELLGLAGSTGTNLKQLKDAAELHGLHALGVQISADDLMRVALPAIVHFGDATFAAVLDYSKNDVRVSYPTGHPVWQSKNRFAERFGSRGRVLLLSQSAERFGELNVSREQSARPEPTAELLRPETNVVSVGCIHAPKWEAQITLSNDGDSPVSIRSIVPSCTCMSAEMTPPTVAPMSSATLHIRGEQKIAKRFTHDLVLVLQNGRSEATMTLSVRGFLMSPVMCVPPVVSFGRITQGASGERVVDLVLAPDVDSSALAATISPGGPLRTTLISDGGPKLLLSWDGSTELGTHRYDIEVGSASFPDGPKAVLGASVDVIPALEVQPASLALRSEELRRGWTRRIRLLHHSGQCGQIECEWSNGDFGHTVTMETAQSENDSKIQTIVLRSAGLSAADTSGTLERHVRATFRTSSGANADVYIISLP